MKKIQSFFINLSFLGSIYDYMYIHKYTGCIVKKNSALKQILIQWVSVGSNSFL